MSDTENLSLSETPADPGIESLRNDLQTLRAALSFTLVLLFVFSACVNIFLFRQASSLSGQAAQAAAQVNNYENGGVQQANEFWLRVNDYARNHPDYQPIITKYSQVIRPPAAHK